MRKIFMVGASAVASVLLMTGCNKQVIDLTYEYSQAQIKMPDGTVIEGKVDSWNDYEGDQLQVKIKEQHIWPIRQTWSSGTEQGQSSGSRGRSCTRTLKILKLESWRQYHETERSNVYLQPVQKAGVRGTVRRWCV